MVLWAPLQFGGALLLDCWSWSASSRRSAQTSPRWAGPPLQGWVPRTEHVELSLPARQLPSALGPQKPSALWSPLNTEFSVA